MLTALMWGPICMPRMEESLNWALSHGPVVTRGVGLRSRQCRQLATICCLTPIALDRLPRRVNEGSGRPLGRKLFNVPDEAGAEGALHLIHPAIAGDTFN